MKFLARCEVDKIKFYKLKKGERSMITIGGRLYRCDDRLMVADRSASQAMVIYDIDATQPQSRKAIKVDPDMTKAYIDSAKLGGTKKNIWKDLGSMSDGLMKLFSAIIVVGIVLFYVVGDMVA